MSQQQNVYMAVYDGFADWEVGYVTAAVNDPQFHKAPGSYALVTVGDGDSPVRSMGGLQVQPDRVLDGLDPNDAAMLILPGAPGWDFGSGLNRDRWLDAVRGFRDAGVPVAAICGATYGLASAGLLNGRPHTSAAAEYLATTGYDGADHYVETDAVNADGVITAGPTHPVAFAREVIDELDLFVDGALEAWTGLYATGKPEHYFALMEAAQG